MRPFTCVSRRGFSVGISKAGLGITAQARTLSPTGLRMKTRRDSTVTWPAVRSPKARFNQFGSGKVGDDHIRDVLPIAHGHRVPSTSRHRFSTLPGPIYSPAPYARM